MVRMVHTMSVRHLSLSLSLSHCLSVCLSPQSPPPALAMASDLHPLPVSQAPRSSAMASFFDDDDGRDSSTPLWFNKGAFTHHSFNSEAYIADLRKFVPLDTLRSELRSHLRLLKGELVELINRDYADFVNLSTKLVDVDGAVLRMRSPLNDLRSKLLLVKESVDASLSALQDGLKRRAEASQAREILEILLDTSHVVSKVCVALSPSLSLKMFHHMFLMFWIET